MKTAFARLAPLLWLFFSGLAGAAEEIDICFNYSCKDEAPAQFSPYALNAIGAKFKEAKTPAAERARITKSLAVLYRLAGRQTPIAVDIAGNYQDESAHGRMDCIDHATTTLRLLKMMARRGWLRYHDVLDEFVQRGFFLTQHFAVAIVEKPSAAAAAAAPKTPAAPKRQQASSTPFIAQDATSKTAPDKALFIIDSWPVDHGEEPLLFNWQDWQNAGEPPRRRQSVQ